MSSGPNKVSDSTSSRRPRPTRRGDLVTIALSGDFGKPRPALILQADQFAATATVTVLLVSSTLVEAPLLRVTVQPNAENGLRSPSQVMVDKVMTVKREKLGQAFGHIDKVMTVKREKLGQAFGHIDSAALLEIERCLAVFLGIAK